MSERDRLRRAPGDPRPAQEARRARARGCFIAATIFCWRRCARQLVLARVAVVLAGARQRERLLAVDVRRAGLQAQRVAAVAKAAVDARDDAAAAVVTPPIASTSSGNSSKLTRITWSIVDAEVLLDGLHRQRRPAERVGGVDLVLAEARDVDDRVARDRELGAVRRRRRASAGSSPSGPAPARLRARLARALGRTSEPRIEHVDGLTIGAPPDVSSERVASSTRSWRNCALNRKSTTESATQPASARAPSGRRARRRRAAGAGPSGVAPRAARRAAARRRPSGALR